MLYSIIFMTNICLQSFCPKKDDNFCREYSGAFLRIVNKTEVNIHVFGTPNFDEKVTILGLFIIKTVLNISININSLLFLSFKKKKLGLYRDKMKATVYFVKILYNYQFSMYCIIFLRFSILYFKILDKVYLYKLCVIELIHLYQSKKLNVYINFELIMGGIRSCGFYCVFFSYL